MIRPPRRSPLFPYTPLSPPLPPPPPPPPRRYHVRPRLVLAQQIHAALEGAAEPAQLGVQPERAGMTDHAARGDGVDGGVECSARGDGDGDVGAVGGTAGNE